MENRNIVITIDLKSVVGMLLGIFLCFILFNTNNSKAQSTSTLDGVFGCVDNANFGGFVTEGNGHTRYANSLTRVVIDSATQTGTASGINNVVSHFETAQVANITQTGAGTFTYAVDSPISGFYQFTLSIGGQTSTLYGILVNSGKTLLTVSSYPYVRPFQTGVCQKM